ncbi:MAG: hypothetical protein QNK03_22200 [Myxococcota bacterium]|nr:hypothetical protein [Myxococcota bacterium]
MPRVFSIDPREDQATLPAERKGSMSFTVTNRSPEELRGKVRLVPQEGTDPSWLKLQLQAEATEGEEAPPAADLGRDDERAYGPNAATVFRVAIEVPDSVAAGDYRFRLDAATVRDPDREKTEGPTVAFAVLPKKKPKWELPDWWWIPLVAMLVIAIGGTIAWWLTRGPRLLERHTAHIFALQPETAEYSPEEGELSRQGTGPVTIQRSAPGKYSVRVENWGAVGSNAQVASLEDGRDCTAVRWDQSTVSVACFDSASGAAADAKYEVLISDDSDDVPGLAYLWANNPTTRDYGPHPAYIFVGASRAGVPQSHLAMANVAARVARSAAIAAAMARVQGGSKEVWNPRITREDPGFYRARFKGFGPESSPNVRVTAYGAGANRCRARWVGEFVEVRCENAQGAPTDTEFSLVVFGD